jgi:membrane protein YdbS with pleckstrin-like domain
MSYVNSVLQPGERIVVRSRLHWIVYWPAIVLAVAGLLLLLWEWSLSADTMLIQVTAVIFFVLVVAAAFYAWFVRWITEIAVTDRRIIYKRGFVMRHTAEMNMDKVASVDVDQSILGRLLDYGTVHVLGTGGAAPPDRLDRMPGLEHLHRIAQPLVLRNAIIAK